MQLWCKTWPPDGSSRIRAKTKTSQETQRSLQKFLPNRKPKVIYTDNSLEFGKAREDLSWNHCTSTPHRSETNGIAERAVRRVKKKIRLQYCCNQVWMKNGGQIPWNAKPICETFKISCLMGKTPYERRFGKPFRGPVIPFGSLVGKKVLPGLFLGYALYAGGIWKCDVLVADLEELETMDASEIYSKDSMRER